MPPLPEEQDNVELDAIAANGVETNDRLESLQDVGEAALVQQDKTLVAIQDVAETLEAMIQLHADLLEAAKGLDIPGVIALGAAQERMAQSLETVSGLLEAVQTSVAAVSTREDNLAPLLQALVLEAQKPVTARLVIV